MLLKVFLSLFFLHSSEESMLEICLDLIHLKLLLQLLSETEDLLGVLTLGFKQVIDLRKILHIVF